ncbi:MAG: hypothetical protein ACFFCH_10855, partial [Promethearchaeota archaeon]
RRRMKTTTIRMMPATTSPAMAREAAIVHANTLLHVFLFGHPQTRKMDLLNPNTSQWHPNYG